MSKAEEKDIIYCGNLRVQASNSFFFFKLSFLNPHSHNTRVKQAQVKG